MRVNGILSFFLFVTFVVLTVDQFVERGGGPFELQKQDSHVFQTEKMAHFFRFCLLYTSPSPRDLSTSRMPSSA